MNKKSNIIHYFQHNPDAVIIGSSLTQRPACGPALCGMCEMVLSGIVHGSERSDRQGCLMEREMFKAVEKFLRLNCARVFLPLSSAESGTQTVVS